MQSTSATLANEESKLQAQKVGTRRLKVRVMKHGDKLGFGVRHDRHKRLQVSTLPGDDSQLRVGDTLLSVNDVDLTGQTFAAAIQQLKVLESGPLVFDIERQDGPSSAEREETVIRSQDDTAIGAMAGATTPDANAVRPPHQALSSLNGVDSGAQTSVKSFPSTTLVSRIEGPSPSVVATTGLPISSVQQPRKRARSTQRAVTMLYANGQPVNVTALLADLKKERAEKAALEEKNAGLRKRLQRMVIQNDEVRVRAKNEVAAAQTKAKNEITEARTQLATVRAQIRLQDRGPDVGRTDSIMNELNVYKAQLERLKAAEAERTGMLTTRYRTECRIATVDAQRVLNLVVGMFQAKLRLVGRMSRDGTAKAELQVACDGVGRLAFMTLFDIAHDFAFYASAAFHSQDPVRHSLEQGQLIDLFGNSLCHEERAGLFYVAIAPMLVVFDPSAGSISLKCQWTEQNALRELARNFRS